MTQTIRVRFAPSPTGHLHIGGLRTAFFNWLFARHHNGVFLLRVEDTDLERSKPEYMQSQLASLKWAGIESDEPVVIQSERFAQHTAMLQKLLQEGKAYKCYCPQKAVSVDGQFIKYDKSCRIRTSPQDPGAPYVVRFALPKNLERVEWNDHIRGNVSVSIDELDDFIIARSDGRPVYNFVVVMDDIFMRISHIIRAEDHISNTPKQILLYQACNAPLPEFAHVPLILGPTGAPLSKRDAATSVTEYKDGGYLPEALLNYLVRLGWSHGDQEIFSIQEMIQFFDLDHVGKKGAIFDQHKLDWVNGVYMKNKDDHELLAYMMVNLAPELTQQLLVWSDQEQPCFGTQSHRLKELVKLYKERTKTLKELAQEIIALHSRPSSYNGQDVTKWTDASTSTYLHELEQILEAMPAFEVHLLSEAVHNFAQKYSLKLVKLAQPIRLALVGKASSPGVFELLALIGKRESIERLRIFRQFLKT